MRGSLRLLRGGDPAALHSDLSERLGVDVRRVTVTRADLLRDTADLMVYYVDQDEEKKA